MAAFECFLFVYFEMVGFTPCAPNELPTSMHAQSKKKCLQETHRRSLQYYFTDGGFLVVLSKD